MAISLVQSSGAVSGNATSDSATITGVAAGNLLVLRINTEDDPSSTVDSVTDDQGNTWTLAGTITGSTLSNRSEIWYCLNAAAGDTTVTVVFSSATDYRFVVDESTRSGGGTWSLDAFSSLAESSSSTSHNCSADGTVIDTTAEAIVFCCAVRDSIGGIFGTCTPGSGYTADTVPDTQIYWQHQVFATPQSNERGAFTSTNNGRSTGAIAAFVCEVPCSPCWWPCCDPCEETYGYCLGGFSTAATPRADKLAFSAETASAMTTANLTSSRWGVNPAAISDAALAAYCAGGLTGIAVVASADKLTFSSDVTAAATTANLSQARSELGAVSERSTKGYFAGGRTGFSGGDRQLTADKLTFSSDTTSAQTTADLSQARAGVCGLTEGTSKGYFCGGFTGASADFVTTSDKIVYSTDTTAAQTTANISPARGQTSGGSDGSTKGYIQGGTTTVPVSDVDIITFSTDTRSAATTSATVCSQAACMSNSTHAFRCGGVTGLTKLDSVNKIAFSSDVITAYAGTLSQARDLLAAVSVAGL